MKSKVVLLLGAGASVAMGYPVGDLLRKEILQPKSQKHRELISGGPTRIDDQAIDEFIQAFRHSQMDSIDSFLARRPEFVEIGKRTIAVILLSKEDPSQLKECHHTDHWYFHFFNKVSSESWEHLDLSNISIVTFNYDRSLEHYLIGAISNSYGKTEKEALRKLSSMRIIHVYGSLGSTNPEDGEYFHYGSKLTPRIINLAAKSLKVIPEGRNDDQTLVEARKILLSADAIGFMGFRYDPTNLQRLDASTTCAASVPRPDGMTGRFIRGTCFGMTKAEINKAIGMTVAQPSIARDYVGWFHQTDCLQFLRETLILDRA